MTSLVALVDCNNFYASCERAFNPKLEGKPIVVLSNNDGCIIARSEEAKALGIPMGASAFKVKPLLEENNVQVFSSNYTLYGDMSARVMQTLAHFSPHLEVYSIDEAFLDMSYLKGRSACEQAQQLRHTVMQWTGLPVSVGIAPTKTLAKLANRFCKKTAGANHVVLLQNTADIAEALQQTEVGAVWGIGRQHAHKLAAFGIYTAKDLSDASDAFVKKHLTVVGLRTVKELRGEPCLQLEEVAANKQHICTSRSFGQPVIDLELLQEATALYASQCAAKLRRQQCCTSAVTVFLQAYPFKNEQAYYNSKTLQLPAATSSTLELLHYAKLALTFLFRPGYRYKKCGVIVSELCPEAQAQLPLLDTIDRAKHRRLMQAVDSINAKWGKETVTAAAQGVYDENENDRKNPWKMKSAYRSNRYTTHLEELLCVQV
ncbi:Y-family DNA polymerase [Pontibacter sp. 172403-2]|uniref:Y-family DNA polymerase n=1 Tax=Pontibacter rufus TaxID=2791028 RepID=UPI0018AFF7AF|nr:Y-family DNA polymerase [Pontibacter sp. 172403-2]MBF9254327.1 Y-family DNA polymerase [Pontibacter sp. 172403-2]